MKDSTLKYITKPLINPSKSKFVSIVTWFKRKESESTIFFGKLCKFSNGFVHKSRRLRTARIYVQLYLFPTWKTFNPINYELLPRESCETMQKESALICDKDIQKDDNILKILLLIPVCPTAVCCIYVYTYLHRIFHKSIVTIQIIKIISYIYGNKLCYVCYLYDY